jgi:predicted nuclease of restriction endonuclease-like (RecB) superfamily
MAGKGKNKPKSTGIVRNTDMLLAEIRELIFSARQAAVRSVNTLQVLTNFEIGKRIVAREQEGQGRAAYGKEIVKALAERLTDEFGNGFSARNLAYMRSFYLLYRGRGTILQTVSAKSSVGKKNQTPSGQTSVVGKKLQTVSAKLPSCPFMLSWSHYVFLMGINNPQERNFYEIEASSNGWSLRELKRQFDSSLYERLALSRDKTDIRKMASDGQVVAHPNDLLKEPYVLEFLGLDEQVRYSESELESAIIGKLEQFLLELGKGFLFEARQKRFTFDDEHYFVDLVFYNRLLRCYVLLDLKIGKLTHQDLGQMQMYVNYYDRRVKTEDEHPTIGIILCKKKHDALVEITLAPDSRIHAREYRLYLPSKEQLRKKLMEWMVEQDSDMPE